MADIWKRSHYIIQFMFKTTNKPAVWRTTSFEISQRLFSSFAIWSVLMIIYSSLYSWLPTTAPRCRLPFRVMFIFVFSNNFSASFTSWGFIKIEKIHHRNLKVISNLKSPMKISYLKVVPFLYIKDICVF